MRVAGCGRFPSVKKRKIKFLQQFSEIGAKHSLSFTRQEVFQNRIIALDGIHRKIVVVEAKEEYYDFLIELSEVKSCKARKIYHSSGRTDNKGTKEEEHLHSIVLQFDFKTESREQILIPFYENHINSIYQMEELLNRAKDWEIFVQKMISGVANRLVR